jgi:hypothetical protein
VVKTLPVFNSAEYQTAHRLLAARVTHMMGRKLEEDDWTAIYCKAKGIRQQGWSNLNIDVSHGALGVEQKMLAPRKSDRSLLDCCGTTLMHPSATRSIRIPDINADANQVMVDVFRQYAELIELRTEKVREESGLLAPDMRTGWLLWQESLREFLYFEERMQAPDPRLFRATWESRASKSARKASKSLWIFEKKTNLKRFSVTTEAGIKIQPYFDVPANDDPNLYRFIVQGEDVGLDLVRVWLTLPTAREVQETIGSLEPGPLSAAILEAPVPGPAAALLAETGDVVEVTISASAYVHLLTTFDGVSDEHRFRVLLNALKAV